MKKLFFLFCCLVLQSGFAQKPKPPKKSTTPKPPVFIVHPTDTLEIATILRQIIVSFPKGITQDQKNTSRTNLQSRMRGFVGYSEFIVKLSKSCPCDTLELWETNQDIITEGHGETAGIKPPPVGGAGDFIPVEFANGLSPNFDLDSFDEAKYDTLVPVAIPYVPNTIYKRQFKIAIMDTGLDTSKIPSSGLVMPNSTPSDSCPNGSWNFIKNNDDFFDDHVSSDIPPKPIQHGTWVTQLLLRELPNKNIKIVAMKVLDEHKQGTLFDLLCAISNAIIIKVDAINMSLGYYGSENVLLKKYMRALNRNKIWVFAAAGNANETADYAERMLHSTEPSFNPRNLDARQYKFYPACFSNFMDKIISVTSVSKETESVCDNQNFSSNFVHLGIRTDNSYCGFYAPTPPSSPIAESKYLVGSSYATPILAGKTIAKLIERGGGDISRFTLLSSLLPINPTSLRSKIQRGRVNR